MHHSFCPLAIFLISLFDRFDDIFLKVIHFIGKFSKVLFDWVLVRGELIKKFGVLRREFMAERVYYTCFYILKLRSYSGAWVISSKLSLDVDNFFHDSNDGILIFFICYSHNLVIYQNLWEAGMKFNHRLNRDFFQTCNRHRSLFIQLEVKIQSFMMFNQGIYIDFKFVRRNNPQFWSITPVHY